MKLLFALAVPTASAVAIPCESLLSRDYQPTPLPLFESWNSAYFKLSLSENMRELSANGLLINQNDVRLSARELLIDNGGLCSSTCGVAVLHGTLAYAGVDPVRFSRNTDVAIEEIVKFAFARFGTDARIGLHLYQLKVALNEISKQFQDYFTLSAEFMEVSKYNPYSSPSSDDTIHIATLAGQKFSREGFRYISRRHAILILGRNPRHPEYLESINPNDPSRVFNYLFYEVKPKGRFSMTESWKLKNLFPPTRSESPNGTIENYIQIRVVRKKTGVRLKEFLQSFF